MGRRVDYVGCVRGRKKLGSMVGGMWGEGGGRKGAGRRWWKQCLEERRKREMIKEIGKV